jgi:hypothetical protein
MQQDIALLNKLSSLPEQMKAEVNDFIDFLAEKARKQKAVENKPKAKFGSAKGMFKMAPDFDEPLEDFKDYM